MYENDSLAKILFLADCRELRHIRDEHAQVSHIVYRISSSASSFRASLLQAIEGVMPSALCPPVVSQALGVLYPQQVLNYYFAFSYDINDVIDWALKTKYLYISFHSR